MPNEAFAALLTAGTDVEVVCGSESGTVTRVPGRVAELPAAGGSSGSGTPFAAGSAPSVVIVMEHTDVSDALHCSQQIWSSVVVVH